MNWNPQSWKRSIRLLLGLVTIWPVIYIFLFVSVFFIFFLTIPFAVASESNRRCGDLDVFELEDKIKNDQIKQLTIKSYEIEALDNVGNCEFHASVSKGVTRDRIIRTARETNSAGQPHVPRIVEEPKEPEFPPLLAGGGMVLFFGAHLLTMFLSVALLPLYIVLAVKDERHDQTMRIVWVVLLCSMGMLAMPVYWFLYIWRNSTAAPAALNPT